MDSNVFVFLKNIKHQREIMSLTTSNKLEAMGDYINKLASTNFFNLLIF